MTGRSLVNLLRSPASGWIENRAEMLIGKERHDIGRPGDVGYPIRGLLKADSLFLQNFEPSRWPACNPETGYLNVDASPTKSFILHARREKGSDPYWELCFGMRPGQELYDLSGDTDCVKNLATTRVTDVETSSSPT